MLHDRPMAADFRPLLDEMIRGIHAMKMKHQGEERRTRERRTERRKIAFSIESPGTLLDSPTVLAHFRVGRPPDRTKKTRDNFHVWAMLTEAADAWESSDRFRGPFMKAWRQSEAELHALLKGKLGDWDAVRREKVGVIQGPVEKFLRTPRFSVETSTDPVEHEEVAVQTEEPKSLAWPRSQITPKIHRPDLHK
jgi:hypothetical protein